MRLKAISIWILIIGLAVSFIPVVRGAEVSSSLFISFSCQERGIVMQAELLGSKDDKDISVEIRVLSPEGFYIRHFNLTFAKMEGFAKGEIAVGSCNKSYVVEVEFDGRFYSYFVNGVDNDVTYCERQFGVSPVYITGSLTPTENLLSFDIYYENTENTTITLSASDIHFVAMLYSGDYLLYNSTYDVRHKFIKSILKRDRTVIIPPHSSKRLITLRIPLHDKEIERDSRLIVYVDRGKWTGFLVNMPLSRSVNTDAIPQWAIPILKEFNSIGVIPWEELTATVSRGDISLLLGSTLGKFYLFSGHPFKDVSMFDRSFTSISMLKFLGRVGGYPDGSFKPYVPLRRVEAAIFLLKYLYGREILKEVSNYHVEGIFKDIDKKAWYAPWVEIAFKKGLIKGYGDGTFRPEKFLNRIEAIVLVYRAYLLGK